MKAKHELIALAVMILICLLFAACAQKAEDKLTDKATDPALITSSAAEVADDTKDATEKETEEQSQADTDAMSVNPDTALEELQVFYGSLYTVKETGNKNSKYYYTVNDNNGKKYADVTVDTSTANITEKLADGTVNEWNMLV